MSPPDRPGRVAVLVRSVRAVTLLGPDGRVRSAEPTDLQDELAARPAGLAQFSPFVPGGKITGESVTWTRSTAGGLGCVGPVR